MGVERFDLSDEQDGRATKKTSVPTEQQVIDALEGWEEGAAYRKVRHAANVGGCYSTETICLAHEILENQKLTDDLVQNRLAHGEFAAAELNPTAPGAPSVCEHVSVPVLNRLLSGMRGTFTPDEAYYFCDYHLEECDYETLRLVAAKTSLSPAERRTFVEFYDWMANPEYAPGTGDAPRQETVARGDGRQRKARVVLGAVAAVALVVVALLMGAALVAGIGIALLVSLVIALALTSDAAVGISGKYPDMRSEYHKRVWAEDHNYEADGYSDHNWEADGDRPW